MAPDFPREIQRAVLEDSQSPPSGLPLRGSHPLWRSVPEDFGSAGEEVLGPATPHLRPVSWEDSVCPLPFSIAFTHGISIDFFSWGY